MIFTRRSQEKEIMDLGPDYYTAEEYRDCLNKLFRVNRFLGFFSSTVKLLRRNFQDASTLLDIGCGGGLFVLHLNQRFPHIKMTGIDICDQAIKECQAALQSWQKKNAGMNVNFVLQSKPELHYHHNSFDLILVTLVCHHLDDQELINFLQSTYQTAKTAVIINDLQRHRLAERLYALISPIFFRNRLITHDGLISIRRGFTRAEWKLIIHRAGISSFRIKWCFPFRWRVVLIKDNLKFCDRV